MVLKNNMEQDFNHITKKIIEDILKDYSHAYGLKYIALRYFNAAGCDADGEIIYEKEYSIAFAQGSEGNISLTPISLNRCSSARTSPELIR